ncbi:SMP-30/gluconolactonase/LRE family protein [Agrobacterium deltaense]
MMFYLDPPIRLKPATRVTLPPEWVAPRRSDWADCQLGGRLLGSFLEGPCFDGQGNLYLVDIPFGRIIRVSEDGRPELVTTYEGWPNGLKILRDGRILVADHRLGLVEINARGEAVVLVDNYRGERFRGLNDLTVGPNGWIYFTDQGQSGLQEPNGAVYRWNISSLRLERILAGIPSPNGLVLSCDAKRLFVAVTRANAIWRLPFVRDGGVSKVGVFLNLSGGGGPDGLAMDREGGLIVAQPGLGVLRFDEAGRLTHVVEVPEGTSTSNITFGENDSRVLFIADSAGSRVLAVEMPFAGATVS